MINKYLERLESELQIVIPEDYKVFFKEGLINIGKISFAIGKGCPDLCYENKANENDEIYDFVAIDTFYGIIENNEYDLLKNNINDFGKSRIPSDFITIASSLSGDQICLGVKGEYTGKVYMWEMEFEAGYDTPQPYYGNMTLITNTFQEFLDGLFIDE